MEGIGLYLLLFGYTLLDQSGIPISIMLAGILHNTQGVNLVIALLVINLSMIVWDIFLILGGYYLNKRYQHNQESNSQLYNLNKRVMNMGVKLIDKDKYTFYLLGNFLPYIGKFLPIIIGYKQDIQWTKFIILVIGNLIYSCVFISLGNIFGMALVEYSWLIIVISIIIFISILYSVITLKRKWTNIKKQYQI